MHDFAELAPSNPLSTVSEAILASAAAAVLNDTPAATAAPSGVGEVVANAWMPGKKERVPDSEWASWWDGGAAYDGGGAFNNTMAGFEFEIVPLTTSALVGTAKSGEAMISMDADATTTTEPNVVVDAVIITGKRLASEFEFARVVARYTPGNADDLVTTMGALMFGNMPHSYVTLHQVGDTACDADEAWEALVNFGAAPGQTGPVSTGSTTNVTGFGPVTHTVDAATKTITNTTLPGHLLYPGTVTRQVIESNGKVYIQTTGAGTGQFSGINMLGSNMLWGNMDRSIAQYVDANDNGPGDC